MTHVLDTSRLPVADRADFIRDVLSRTMERADIEFDGNDRGASAHGVITDVGRVRVCSVRSNATALHRTPAFARGTTEPTIFIALQTPGSGLRLSQDGRQTALSPGELAFTDSSAAYSLHDPNGIQQHFFAIKVAALALPHDLVHRLRAVTLCPGHPVAGLAAAYFARLATNPDITMHPGAETLGQPTIELVRALITTHLAVTTPLAKDSLQNTLVLRILEYTRARLHDPDLNAAQIAAEHHISVRHLYNVLGRSGISLGDWIRTQRLEACHADLVSPQWRHLTIASVARRSGFTDASSFGRVFRAAYELTPRQWRAHGAATS